MSDESKLGLVAGVLAVVAVAVFSQSKEASPPPAKQVQVAVGNANAPPNLPPAAVPTGK